MLTESPLTKLRSRSWQARRSLKTVILWLFIPIMILLVLVIGILTYTLAARQIQANAYLNIGDTVTQTRKYLDNRLTAIFEQLVAFENDNDTLSLFKRLSSKKDSAIRPEDYIQSDRNLERIFTSYYSMLDSILIYFNQGQLVLSKKDYMSSQITFNYLDWRLRFTGNRSEYYWRTLHENDVFLSTDSNSRIASLFRLYGDDQSKLSGIILFNLKEDFFKEILEDARISENGYLLLLNDEGIVNFKDVPVDYSIDGKIKQLLLADQKPSGRLTVRNGSGRKMIIIYDTIPINKWKLAAVFPEHDILNRASFIKNITLAVMIFLIFTAVFLSNVLAKMVTTPLIMLTDKVKQVKAGNLDVPFDVEHSNEIGILNGGIRELLGRVRSLLEQIRREQEQKRLAELDTLQSQIKPHFLYNTLDSIKQLCELGETHEAGKMVAALAKFFRISLSGGKEVITIWEELEHIRNYLFILTMRYADGFSYQFEIDPEIYEYKIIKLTLQPLVENAIYHGIKQKRGKGVIAVKGYRQQDRIIIEVIDDGAGMNREKLEQLKESLITDSKEVRGFGLRNVQRRLQLHYGQMYGIQIESENGEGTRIWVILPAER